MIIPGEFENDFYSGIRSRTVPFIYNDYVCITSHPYRYKCGAVTSIFTIEPSLTYLVKFNDGKAVVIESKQMEIIEPNMRYGT